VYGPEASGKTTLALHAVAEVQKAGGQAVFVDAEHAFNPHFARRLGVNVDVSGICRVVSLLQNSPSQQPVPLFFPLYFSLSFLSVLCGLFLDFQPPVDLCQRLVMSTLEGRHSLTERAHLHNPYALTK
jgi:hypothetical protein